MPTLPTIVLINNAKLRYGYDKANTTINYTEHGEGGEESPQISVLLSQRN